MHESGHLSGSIPVLVMDVWEHAFMLDYAVKDRPKYIDAFLSNVDWRAVDQRLSRRREAIAA
jgi:Fe-Mn family superoxide dismutase